MLDRTEQLKARLQFAEDHVKELNQIVRLEREEKAELKAENAELKQLLEEVAH